MRIYKYSLDVGLNTLALCRNFKPLMVADQRGTLTLWVLENPNNLVQAFRIGVVPTGDHADLCGVRLDKHIGSCIASNGTVWHVFMETP